MRLPEPRALPLQGPLALSAALHLAVIVLLAWETSRPPASPPPGPPGEGAGRRVDYLALPPFRAPAPPDQTRLSRPAARPVMRAEVLDVAPATSLADALPVAALPSAILGAAGSGSGGAVVGGTGRGSGAGASGGGGEVFPPQARYSILPPLPRPPSVRGKTFRVHFWVDAAGRVTRVDVSPPIPDGEYRKQFTQLMYQYTFAPAVRPDGTPVAGETVLVITL